MLQDDLPNQTKHQAREERIEHLMRQYQERLEKVLSQEPLTLDEMEKLAQQIGEQVKQEVQKDLLESVGPSYVGGYTRCSCSSQLATSPATGGNFSPSTGRSPCAWPTITAKNVGVTSAR